MKAVCPCCGHDFEIEITIEPDIMQQSYVDYSISAVTQAVNLPCIDDIAMIPELSGVTVCFTGFNECDKEHLNNIAVRLGMICKTGVSKKLELLVCGYKPGPRKLSTAKELNITILRIEEFKEKYLPEQL